MKSYFVNYITSDFLEITLTYLNIEFERIKNSAIEHIYTYNDEVDVDYYKLSKNELYNDKYFLNALRYVIDLDIEKIVDLEKLEPCFDDFVNDETRLKIMYKEGFNEVMIVLSWPFLDPNITIELPSFIDLSTYEKEYNAGIDKDLRFKNMMDMIKKCNGYVREYEVNIVGFTSEVYIDLYGRQILLNHDLPYLHANKYDYLGCHVGDEIDVYNSKMNERCDKYKITKIVGFESIDLTDEMVKKLDYSFNTVEEFKRKLEKDLEYASFSNTLLYMHQRLKEINADNIEISKYLLDFVFDKLSEDTMSEKNIENNINREIARDIVVSVITSAYLEKKYFNGLIKKKYDISYLDNFFRSSYRICKLLKKFDTKDIRFNDFVSMYENDAILYTIIKMEVR